MPRFGKIDLGALSNPALNDKIIEFAEREAKELADLGIGILAEAVKRRLSRPRPSRASTASQQNGHGPPQADVPQAAGPYQVLGVAPEAPMEDVERAFRKRVMACHPDRGGDEDELRRVLAAVHQIREERKS
jgi:DnaJ-domain-containing protein 1